jgi:homogentisate 1,2-dioxygenase
MLDRMLAGRVADKHHVALRGPDGTLHYEECLTRDGFDGPYTILYHQRPPHLQAFIGVDPDHGPPTAAPASHLARRHYKTFELPRGAMTRSAARTPLLFNDDVVISVLFPGVADASYFVNGDGDDLYFVLEGGGTLRSALGDLAFRSGDYVLVPKGVLHRFVLDGAVQYWLGIECRRGVGLPRQWRNPVGQLRMDAPYSHRDFGRPRFVGPLDEGLRELVVKRGDLLQRYALEHSPLDVVGWDGTVYPLTFPILNFQPRVGQVHLPPTWHGTFAAGGALICSFVPRPLDFHPEAIPCPYPHTSVDVDEVLFYCRGSFTSRRGIAPGSLSHHPAGIPHGPHAGAYEGSIGERQTAELAVMLDCHAPLARTEAARAIEDQGYHDSFG